MLGGLLIDSAGATVLGIAGSSMMLAAAVGVFATRTVAKPLAGGG